jgi:hypothetical protein
MFKTISLFKLFAWGNEEINSAIKFSVDHYKSKGFEMISAKNLPISCLQRKSDDTRDISEYEKNLIKGEDFYYIACPPSNVSEKYFTSTYEDRYLTKVELSKSIKKIENAMGLFREYGPEIYKFIIAQVGYIQIWDKDSLDVSSSNTGDYDARILLCNIDRDSISVFKVMEIILHESIHCFLNVYEDYHPFSSTQIEVNDLVFSKWTKNKIQAYSVLHACFVWYGLYNLAEKMKSCDQMNKAEIRKLQHISQRGFVMPGDILDSIKISHRAINKYVFDEIASVQSWFREGYILELSKLNGQTFKSYSDSTNFR